MPNPKISVTIPVYNGEEWIEETLNSILNQTFVDFEVVCVDDCSTDGGFEILKKYSQRDARIKIYRTKSNFGIVPKVLNYMIPHINGNYFVYASQDDLFSTDWLNSMYSRAIETGADAVIPELVLWYGSSPKNKIISGLYGDKSIVLDGRDAFKYSLDWSIPGNALWRTEFIRKYPYYDYGMNADEYTARCYFLLCEKVAFSSGTFFYRQNNPNAITKSFSNKFFEVEITKFKLWRLAIENGLEIDIQRSLISQSVNGVLDLYPITFKKKHKAARVILEKILTEYEAHDVHAWLTSNAGTRSLTWLATSSRITFYLVSFSTFLFKRATKKIKKIVLWPKAVQ